MFFFSNSVAGNSFDLFSDKLIADFSPRRNILRHKDLKPLGLVKGIGHLRARQKKLGRSRCGAVLRLRRSSYNVLHVEEAENA